MTKPERASNKPAAPNAGIVSRLTVGQNWPGVGEPGRSVDARIIMPMLKQSVRYMAALMLVGFPVIAADIDTMLMHYTFKIEGPASEQGKVAFGTGFVLGIVDTNGSGRGVPVLVTAAHVLEQIRGDGATIHYRLEQPGGRYQRAATGLQIRAGGTNLYVRHPKADVAVMRVSIPQVSVACIGTALLADDDILRRFEIHPGDELRCLGFPYGAEGNEIGFPILRSGRIASYPLVPSAQVGSFLFDFQVFEGNSGGPVYFSESGRTYGGAMRAETIQFVVGLLSEQKFQLQQTIRTEQSPDRKRFEVDEQRFRLGLGVVVPSHFIRETVVLLERSPAVPK